MVFVQGARAEWRTWSIYFLAVNLVGGDGKKQANVLRRTSLGECFVDPSQWSIVKRVIGCVHHNAIPLFVFVEMIANLWDERNKCQFQGKWIRILLKVILLTTTFSGNAFMEEVQSQKVVTRFRKGLADLEEATKLLQLAPNVQDGN